MRQNSAAVVPAGKNPAGGSYVLWCARTQGVGRTCNPIERCRASDRIAVDNGGTSCDRKFAP